MTWRRYSSRRRGQIDGEERRFERRVEELLAPGILHVLAGLVGEPEIVVRRLDRTIDLHEAHLAQAGALAAQLGAVQRGQQADELGFEAQRARFRHEDAQVVGVNPGVGPAVDRQQPLQPLGVELEEEILQRHARRGLGRCADEQRLARGPEALGGDLGPIAIEAIVADGDEVGGARLPRSHRPARDDGAAPNGLDFRADDAVVHD